jgi:hypothetical protein
MFLSGISCCSFRLPSSARRLPTCRDSPRNAPSSRTTACVQVWINVMQLMHILGLSPFFRNRPRSGAASAGLRHHSCPPRPYASHRSRSWCGQLAKPSFGIPLPNGYNRTEICHCLPTSGRMFYVGKCSRARSCDPPSSCVQRAVVVLQHAVHSPSAVSYGEKLYDLERVGVPIRIDIGARDIASGRLPVTCRVPIDQAALAAAGVGGSLQRASQAIKFTIGSGDDGKTVV